MNAATWLVRRLKSGGVERIFALCGNGLDPFLDACFELDMPVIDVRNEQVASYMADTWGRLTGRLGVVAVSSGPGHTNALTGLANSYWDGGPMLLISGCSPQQTLGMDNFQELDQVGMAAPVCKYAGMVHDVHAMPQQVETALQWAVSGRPGPVHLTVPVDVLQAEIGQEQAGDPQGALRVEPRGCGDDAQIRRAIETLAKAQRPFMVLGSGAFYANAWGPLARFAAAANIPIVSHIWDRGCIEQPLPQYMGITNEVLNGSMARLAEADCILTVGARIDYRLGHGRAPLFPRDARVIRIDAEPAEVARTVVPDVGIVGSPRTVLTQMADAARELDWAKGGWLARVRASRDELLDSWEDLCREDCCPVPGLRICREIKPFLDREVTFLLDGGNIGRWAHMVLFDRHPAHWFTCGISGVVGWGFSGAIAAKLARPEHPVLLLSGDGAAGFNVTDIETALRFGTPYTAVIAHDSAWGIVVDGQPDGRHVASELGEIRFDKLAEALGGKGIYIDDPRDLAPAIEWGLAQETVVIIQVPTQQAGTEHWMERFG